MHTITIEAPTKRGLVRNLKEAIRIVKYSSSVGYYAGGDTDGSNVEIDMKKIQKKKKKT